MWIFSSFFLVVLGGGGRAEGLEIADKGKKLVDSYYVFLFLECSSFRMDVASYRSLY